MLSFFFHGLHLLLAFLLFGFRRLVLLHALIHIALDRYDKNIVLNALNTLRTQQIQEERPTDPVDELISTVAHAPTKRVKVVHCRCNEER